jgi:hypothetical protein
MGQDAACANFETAPFDRSGTSASRSRAII